MNLLKYQVENCNKTKNFIVYVYMDVCLTKALQRL